MGLGALERPYHLKRLSQRYKVAFPIHNLHAVASLVEKDKKHGLEYGDLDALLAPRSQILNGLSEVEGVGVDGGLNVSFMERLLIIYATTGIFPEFVQNSPVRQQKKASRFDRPPSITNSIHFQLVTIPIENRLADPLNFQQLLHRRERSITLSVRNNRLGLALTYP